MNLSFKEPKRNLKKDFAGFDKTPVAILADTASQLFSFKPDFVIIYNSSKKLLNSFYNKAGLKESFEQDNINFIRQLADTLNTKLDCKAYYISMLTNSLFKSYNIPYLNLSEQNDSLLLHNYNYRPDGRHFNIKGGVIESQKLAAFVKVNAKS